MFCRLKIKALFIILSLFTICTYAQKPDIKFDNVNKDNGLSNNIVKAITQDSYGFLWFGTKNGLNKFDGTNFNVFYHDIDDRNSLPDNFVTSIADKDDSTLLIGTYTGNIALFNKNTELFNNDINRLMEKAGIISSPISKILIDNNSSVWISTLGAGLLKLDLENNSIEIIDDKTYANLSSVIISDFEFDNNGFIWLATQGKYICVFHPNEKKIEQIPHDETLQNNRKSFGKQLFIDNNNRIWLGTETNGLYQFDINTKTFKQFLTEENSALGSNFITAIEGDKKYLYIGTDGGGLCVFDYNKMAYSYNKDDATQTSISTDAIWSLYLSKDGNLWVGTFSEGVDIVNPQKTAVKTFSRTAYGKNAIENKSVLAICMDEDSTLWIGTDGYGLRKLNLGSDKIELINTFSDGNKCPKVVKSIFLDSEHNIWIGSYAQGLYLANKKINAHKKIIDKLKNESIWDIMEDADGNLWFGTLYSGVFKYNLQSKKTVHYLNNPNDKSSISSNTINVIFEDSKKNIWIGTESGGINLYDKLKDNFTQLKTDTSNSYSLRCNTIRSIAEDNKGNLWFGTATGGLSRLLNFRTNTFIHFNTKTDFVSNSIADIIVGKDDDLWISTDKGLCKLNTRSEKIQLIDKSYGLPSNSFNYQSAIVYNSKLYFGSTKGLCSFSEKDFHYNRTMPLVYIKGLRIMNRDIKINEKYNGRLIINQPLIKTKSIKLHYTDKLIQFEIAFLNFSTSKNNQYKYLLEGFDKTWNKSSINQQYINYTNLKGGKYNLRLIPFNSDGTEGKEVNMFIFVEPAFYKTTIFKILIAFAILLFFSLTVYTIILIQKKQRERLEKKVEKRTILLNEQKIKIEEHKEQLLQVNIILQNQKKELIEQKDLLESSNEEIMKKNKQLAVQSDKLAEMNKKIFDQDSMIKKQSETLEFKNSKLTKNLNYAKKIQTSLFPNELTIKSFFPNSFVFFNPKDVVSGDFIWMKKIEEKIIFAVVDCSGHGIPGAFMSIIGNTLLNDIIVNKKIFKPSDILYKINEKLLEIFHLGNYDSEVTDEGMDITVAIYNHNNNTLKLASALQNIYIDYNGEIEIIRGDIFSVGGLMSKYKKPVYEDKEIDIVPHMRMYFLTDGIIDQIGGENREKYGSKRLLEFFNTHRNQHISEISEELKNEYKNWITDLEQLDDILIFGLEF